MAEKCRNQGSSFGKGKNSSILQNIRRDSGAQIASYPLKTEVHCILKRTGSAVENLPSIVLKLKIGVFKPSSIRCQWIKYEHSRVAAVCTLHTDTVEFLEFYIKFRHYRLAAVFTLHTDTVKLLEFYNKFRQYSYCSFYIKHRHCKVTAVLYIKHRHCRVTAVCTLNTDTINLLQFVH